MVINIINIKKHVKDVKIVLKINKKKGEEKQRQIPKYFCRRKRKKNIGNIEIRIRKFLKKKKMSI